MSLKWLTACCVVCAGVFGSANAAHAQNLVRAELTTHTGGCDKDRDSRVFCEVRTADKSVVLAEVSGGDGDKEYKDNSDNTLALVVRSKGSTLSDCDKFVFRIGMDPHGRDKWEFRGKVTLYFDNGKTLVQEIGDAELDGKFDLKWTNWAGGK
jgi:hypothetical protein